MRYSIDWIPVSVVLSLLGLSLVPFLIAMPLWALILLGLIILLLKNAALAAQHNHAHLNVFKSKTLNFIYDLLLAQVTGYSTPEWELQHARGHHQSYLSPLEDLTSPIDAKTGQNLGLWSFTWQGTRKSFSEALQIAHQDRRKGKLKSTWALWGHLSLQILLTTFWILCNPLMGLCFFALSNLTCRAMLWWGTYWQHINAPCTQIYDASNTTIQPALNTLVFNNGYHTAHHEQAGLHWSLLPARTAAIREKIPDRCYRSDINFHLPFKETELAPENRL